MIPLSHGATMTDIKKEFYRKDLQSLNEMKLIDSQSVSPSSRNTGLLRSDDRCENKENEEHSWTLQMKNQVPRLQKAIEIVKGMLDFELYYCENGRL
ncbi:hypothetical protein TNIN_338121 [Trichonephila inaurata madagascariensis]|uniref:Uncharacterized protein n=1 Tax=Trichonephila inaurata madagascariensis TaxID=2747483 RepID=A0A8X7CCU7_9ARAC|nr:hypothetical protein TNIN_432661 [Trichonephila inaurata madagascariensis]GFY60214.1 hypothetical protein TNIN_338121 [Trichonephila inaurata madagascariensis]